jgi:cell wall-associated NlpC family hydrolase
MADDSKLYAAGGVAIGGLFLYSAIKGKSVLSAAGASIRGTSPATAANLPETLPSNVIGSAAIGVGQATGLAADAERYVGAGYVWAGVPARGIGDWDCSSFTNWCAGHDLGLAIPGFKAGAYNGSEHGPATGQWLIWPGLVTVGTNGNEAQAGDLAIWLTHMGICIGPNEMVSAQNPKDGTRQSGINGFIAEPLTIRRYVK